MKKTQLFTLFFALLLFNFSYCQQATDENKDKIAAVIENYFDLEREAIHLHIDKTTFITNESIWYQGYIINRKTSKPYFTTNVFVLLYDEKGNQLSEKLIFANNGYFSGKIDLNSKLHSGNYYIQVYTNWMNNFSENESTLTKINIINPEEGIKSYRKLNEESLEIFLTPEGNSFIKGITNVVGVQIKDCRGNAPKNLDATIENSKGEVMKTFKLNGFGLGKFEVIPDDDLRVIIEYNGKKIEKSLPLADNIGFTTETNDYTMEGNVVMKIKTNTQTLKAMQAKKIYLLAHQDQKYYIYDIPLNNETQQTIYLKKTDLWPGINTLRIIDSDLKQWSERLIYLFPKIKSTTLSKKRDANGNINLTGQSPFNNAYMSISVLPEETKCWNDNTTIFSGLTINPYINEPLSNSSYYFNATGRTKFYELDLAILNQSKTKYEWNYMKSNPPTSLYSFDIGITIKGKINTSIKNKTFYKAKLVSYKNFIMSSSDVSEIGEYGFDHILITDSTTVDLSLQKLPNFEVMPDKLIPQIINRKKPFNKQFPISIPQNCDKTETEDFLSSLDVPKFSSNVIQLEEVKVTSDKKKLTYYNKIGNGNLRGYKVDEKMLNQTLLDFIERNGFTVVRNFGLAEIYSRLKTTLNSAQAKPDMYIDERRVRDSDEFSSIKMNEIDEIYLNPHAIVASMDNNIGIIKIYRKKNLFNNYNQKQNPNLFFIKEGFSQISDFKNADYVNTQNNAFNNFGLLSWLPRLETDENGQFNFEITDYNKDKGMFIVEGISFEGELFEEEQTINLK